MAGIELKIAERMTRVKSRKIYWICIIAVICTILSGCSAGALGWRIGERINDFRESVTENQTSWGIDSDDAFQEEASASPIPAGEEKFPIVYAYSHAGDGEIHVSVNHARIVNNWNDLSNAEGFIDESTYVYDGTKEELTEYEYPDMFCEDGSILGNIYMVVLDVTLSNPEGATNRYKSASGEWKNHFSNPYLFSLNGIFELHNKNSMEDHCITPAYFSDKDVTLEQADGIVLNPDDEKTFEVGFFVGTEVSVKENQLICTPILPEDLVLWTVHPKDGIVMWDLCL